MKKNKLFVWGMAAVALAFIVVLAGCGGGKDIEKLYEEIAALRTQLKNLDRDDDAGEERLDARIAKARENLEIAWADASAKGASYSGKHELLNKPEQFEYELTEDGAGVRIERMLSETERIPIIINVPAEIEGYPVVEIGGSAFQIARIISVTLPNSVTKLEDGYNSSAIGHTRIASITLPPGLTKIGDGCFAGSIFTSITIPANVTTIGRAAFSGCDNLTEVTIPEGITIIRSVTFSDCDKLTTVTIPESVTAIEDSAFSFCDELTTVNLPSHPIKYVHEGGAPMGGDNDAFSYCPKLSIAARKIIQDTGYTGNDF